MRRSTLLLSATIGFGLIYLASVIAIGTTPEPGDSGQTVAAWFRDNDGNVRASAWLLTLGGPVFATFAALAVAEQLIETITIFGRHGFIAPGGPMNIYLGAGLTGLAILCLGITAARISAPQVATTT